MATLKTNTLTGTSTAGSIAVTGEGNSTTTNLQQGLCKSFATFNGTGTAAIRDSFNVSTFTDNETADFSFAFTNNFSTADAYVAGGMVAHSATSNSTYTLRPKNSSTLATSAARMQMVYNTDSAQGVSDYAYGSTTMHGDLA